MSEPEQHSEFWFKAMSFATGGPVVRVIAARVRHRDGREEDISHESVIMDGNIAFSPDGEIAKDDVLVISYEVEIVHPELRDHNGHPQEDSS